VVVLVVIVQLLIIILKVVLLVEVLVVMVEVMNHKIKEMEQMEHTLLAVAVVEEEGTHLILQTK
jgi:hypothetical protein|tara:strand:- start:788 stop:979 length:192 start_codon:yes stop_codon:yes gene_type:complete